MCKYSQFGVSLAEARIGSARPSEESPIEDRREMELYPKSHTVFGLMD